MNTEPCPHCDGTGERLVPPPPARRGGQRRTGQRRHGYAGTYTAGKCRCDLCRAAWREYVRNRKQRSAA